MLVDDVSDTKSRQNHSWFRFLFIWWRKSAAAAQRWIAFEGANSTGRRTGLVKYHHVAHGGANFVAPQLHFESIINSGQGLLFSFDDADQYEWRRHRVGTSTQFLYSELGNLLDVGLAGRNVDVIDENRIDRIERSGAQRNVAGVAAAGLILRLIRRRFIAWWIQRAFRAGGRIFAEDLDNFVSSHENAIDNEDGAEIVDEFAASAGFR